MNNVCYINRIEKNCVWRKIDQETIILTKDGEYLHRLNEVGTEIWEVSDGSLTMDEIVSHICLEFEVDERIARQDLLEFTDELSKMQLIELRPTKTEQGD